MSPDISKLERFVQDCEMRYYSEGIEPGNPMHGVWEKAHHPVPKCAGGTETMWLLKEHHAIHNVIQSDCYDRCCVWSWEFNYLEGEMLERAKWWKAENGRRNLAAQTHEQKSAYGRKREASKTDERRKEIGQKISETTRSRYTAEERSEMVRKSSRKKTPEQKRLAGVKGGSANKGVPKNYSADERKKRADAARKRNQIMNNTLYEDPLHPEIGKHNLGNIVRAQRRAGLPCGKENRVEVV